LHRRIGLSGGLFMNVLMLETVLVFVPDRI
jgi:hypothetical protein